MMTDRMKIWRLRERSEDILDRSNAIQYKLLEADMLACSDLLLAKHLAYRDLLTQRAAADQLKQDWKVLNQDFDDMERGLDSK